MGKYKINDEGRWRWFYSDDEYYAYLRVRSEFESADEYERYMSIRVHFNSDDEFLSWLKRHRDEGYQKWLSWNSFKDNDSQEYYRMYQERINDSVFCEWMDLRHSFIWRDMGFHDSEYLKYLEDLSKYGGEEKLTQHIQQEQEKREKEELIRQERPKRVTNAVLLFLSAFVLLYGLLYHWKALGIILLLTGIFVLCKIVRFVWEMFND